MFVPRFNSESKTMQDSFINSTQSSDIFSAAFLIPNVGAPFIIGLAVGLFLGLRISRIKALHEKTTADNRGKLYLAASGIIGMVAFDRVGRILADYQSDSIVIMSLYVLSYMFMGLWLTVGMYLLLATRKNVI